jgi:DNA-binding winged helix-turn-helix (wHTH) protein
MIAFGPFRLDLRTFLLSRDGAEVPLSPRLAQVLACLADARGELVTREVLMDRFWPDVNVTDNTLTRAVTDIRKALDDDPAHPVYVQTMARRGYRFVAPVRVEGDLPSGPATPDGTASLSAGLEPFVAWERGRAALESLSAEALPGAVDAFTHAVAGAPQYAPAHAGLANAHLFRHEATRVDNLPDIAALDAAIASARRATGIDPSMGEGWAVLGHALGAAGQAEEARAAVRHALAVEPRNWRHHYRMAVTSWGEERFQAVERAQALLPGFAAYHTLSAMVLIARQSFALAAEVAARGASAQAAQQTEPATFPATGLLWVRGLTALALGRTDAALADFRAEAEGSSRHGSIYARECVVIARLAEGFALLAAEDRAGAAAAFTAVAAVSPGHARAALGRVIADGASPIDDPRLVTAGAELERGGKRRERELLMAAAHAFGGAPAEAIACAERALAGPPDATGWSLPADPMFAPLRALPGYARLAARLASRAA